MDEPREKHELEDLDHPRQRVPEVLRCGANFDNVAAAGWLSEHNERQRL